MTTLDARKAWQGWRSLLFVPASDQALCGNVARSGTDAAILDLEDGVAAGQKDLARSNLASVAEALERASVAPLVRINAHWRGALADLSAAVIPPVAALVVPKVDSAARLHVISEMVTEFEIERGLSQGRIGLVALIEAPWAIPELPNIAAVDRVIGLALGSEDYSLGLGVAPRPAALEWACRAVAAAAARRCQLAAAVPFSIAAYRDQEGFAQAARLAAGFGANCALCVHPLQVAVANEVFIPSTEDCEQAQRVVLAWDEALRAQRAVAVLGNLMIDAPVVERARRLLARAPKLR
jgi:citrate lyase subunit beta/citryl-CoA lyase